MVEVLRAALLATRDMFRPGMLFHAIWPPMAATLLWGGIAWWLWAPARTQLVETFPDWGWLANTGVSDWIANFLVLLAFAPFVYFTTMMLLAAFALPRMMALIADSDYGDLARAGSNAFWGSIINTLIAGLLFVAGWLATLPLILIPGVLLIMPTVWLAWINQRTFRYDALVEHATPSERYAVVRDHRMQLYLAGVLSALAAHIPFVNFLVPAWTALLFLHLCLLQLRQARREGLVWDQEEVEGGDA